MKELVILWALFATNVNGGPVERISDDAYPYEICIQMRNAASAVYAEKIKDNDAAWYELTLHCLPVEAGQAK